MTRSSSSSGIIVLVAAQRQNWDQELAVALGPKQRSQSSAQQLIACRKFSAQAAAISVPSRPAQNPDRDHSSNARATEVVDKASPLFLVTPL
jgi:hypothetical protein